MLRTNPIRTFGSSSASTRKLAVLGWLLLLLAFSATLALEVPAALTGLRPQVLVTSRPSQVSDEPSASFALAIVEVTSGALHRDCSVPISRGGTVAVLVHGRGRLAATCLSRLEGHGLLVAIGSRVDVSEYVPVPGPDSGIAVFGTHLRQEFMANLGGPQRVGDSPQNRAREQFELISAGTASQRGLVDVVADTPGDLTNELNGYRLAGGRELSLRGARLVAAVAHPAILMPWLLAVAGSILAIGAALLAARLRLSTALVVIGSAIPVLMAATWHTWPALHGVPVASLAGSLLVVGASASIVGASRASEALAIPSLGAVPPYGLAKVAGLEPGQMGEALKPPRPPAVFGPSGTATRPVLSLSAGASALAVDETGLTPASLSVNWPLADRIGRGPKMRGHPAKHCTKFPTVGDTVCDALSAGEFNVRAASTRGLGHRLGGSPRQDCFGISEAAGCLLVAVADGISASPRSELGARLACEFALAHVTETLDAAGDLDAATIMAHTRDSVLAAAAKELEAPIDQHLAVLIATTLCVVVIKDGSSGSGWHYWTAGVGNCEVWDLTLASWRPILHEPRGALVDNRTKSVTLQPDEFSVRTGVLAPSSALFVVSDGVIDAFGEGMGPVGKYLAGAWSKPPDPLEFARTLMFEHRDSVDDRTAVGVWAQ
jgi:hypothetical protein